MDDSQSNLANPCAESIEFKENALMTKYKGHWIQKSRAKFVGGMYHKFYRKVAANKNFKDDKQRQKEFERLTKKLLRDELRMLKLAIVGKSRPVKTNPNKNSEDSSPKKNGSKSIVSKKLDQDSEINPTRKQKIKPLEDYSMKHTLTDGGRRKPGKYLDINYADDPDIVKYQGFFIHKKSLDQLQKVEENLVLKGLSDGDLRKHLRKECRKAERLVKREKKPKIQVERENKPKVQIERENKPEIQVERENKPKIQVEREKKPKIQHNSENLCSSPKVFQEKIHLNLKYPKTHIPQSGYHSPSLEMKPRMHVVFDD